ncbi:transposase family protein [Streptomyces atratus]|uniref:transposase family protein n=1 Tax=Streptomyces atratus TaxID=1893 RepID=UPI0033F2BAE8
MSGVRFAESRSVSSSCVVEFVQHSVDQIVLHAHARAARARCPHCSRASGRVHGRYFRRLVDAAIGGRAVVVELLVRRFRCLNGACTAVTFAEQIEGLTTPHARKTPLLRAVLLSIACTLAGLVPVWPRCWASGSPRTPC